MNIIVLSKFVPNPSGETAEIGLDFRLRRDSDDANLDSADEPGLAIAHRLLQEQGGDVTAVSMGPEPATTAMFQALGEAADKAILVTDDALKGADALATARVLAATIRRDPFDLVIAGVESSDGSTGTMPMTLAELLGIPCATFARRLRVTDERIVIERQTHAGYDVIECPLPAVVTVTASVAEARIPSMRDVMQAQTKPIERLSLADLGLDHDQVRPTQAVAAMEPAPPTRRAGEIVEEPEEAPARFVSFLRQAKVI